MSPNPFLVPVLASDSNASDLGLLIFFHSLTEDATLSSAEAGVKDTREGFNLEKCRVSFGA